jgi:hypothetical protein
MMSASDFEEQILKYLWRALVLAGLLTVLGSAFVPTSGPQIQEPVQGATNTANRVASGSSNPDEAR